ncbi:hypothetical protein EYF80_033854 [Liparis tanakae]|uniref:Uncharacterized protein n=1 Tax=Liparis tanakae TaxID=230148 RepID=A0A4Z2GQG0_9TELE|nr:hypothetical protein EYF80_033854 [Liparis tanakae]
MYNDPCNSTTQAMLQKRFGGGSKSWLLPPGEQLPRGKRPRGCGDTAGPGRCMPGYCSIRPAKTSSVLTAVQSCCISRSGRVSSPGGKGSSSLPKASPELQSAGSRLVGRLGSLEEREGEGRGNKEMELQQRSFIGRNFQRQAKLLNPTLKLNGSLHN